MTGDMTNSEKPAQVASSLQAPVGLRDLPHGLRCACDAVHQSAGYWSMRAGENERDGYLALAAHQRGLVELCLMAASYIETTQCLVPDALLRRMNQWPPHSLIINPCGGQWIAKYDGHVCVRPTIEAAMCALSEEFQKQPNASLQRQEPSQ